MNISFLVLITSCLLITLACSREQKTVDKSARQLVETLARTKLVHMDSIVQAECDSIYNRWYEIYKDSLYQMRKYEIQTVRSDRILGAN
jgi:hypothetical protein